ncbi:insulinase family protein [Bacteroidales bacterium OttesenSCG-928-A17]|nr:insulinase family protein [Bacteroidales bacterium OttesenSCG-928-A17]
MNYLSLTLSNGLRIIYYPTHSPVSYCGFAVNAGTRDEQPDQQGLAHFTEHMLFKGTEKRRSWHILNRMEKVGGELNAYTTKEETFIYSVCLSEDIERAMDLLADLVYNSQFPESEIEKEREVIIDEINSYKDTPSEWIYDEFEDMLFAGNELGHNILGTPEDLNRIDSTTFRSFTSHYYHPENMVFFFYGKTPFSKIKRLADKFFLRKEFQSFEKHLRTKPRTNRAQQIEQEKGLFQSHVIIGGRGYDNHHKDRIGLYLLNNLLGGPGMNSRLNVSLREKEGLVYQVESGLTSYTDCGLFSIYFGCDHDSIDKCIRLVRKELKRLREQRLTTSQFTSAVKQLKGQLGVSSDQSENLALGMGKSFLHFNRYDNLAEIYRKIDFLTADQLLDIANEIFCEDNLNQLVYC